MAQMSRNMPAPARIAAATHSPNMAMPGGREPPRTGAASAAKSSGPATHSAASPPNDRRTGKRSDNPSAYQLSAVSYQPSADGPRVVRPARVVRPEGSTHWPSGGDGQRARREPDLLTAGS